MAVRSFIQITQESSYGTATAAPVRGTNQIVIRLDGANAYTMRPKPIAIDIPVGGGVTNIGATVSDKQELKGTLKAKLCYSQAALLLGWSVQNINSGQTTPWVTTEPAGDLASCTVDFAVWQDDVATYKRERHTGVKVTGGSIRTGEDMQVVELDLNLTGSTYQGNSFDGSVDPTAIVFPVPAATDYANDFVLFGHSTGALVIGASRLHYSNLAIDWQNSIDARFFASRFLQRMRYMGRKAGLEADVVLESTPGDRSTYEQLSALSACTVTFTNSVPHSVEFNFNSNSRFESLTDDLSNEKIYYRKLKVMDRWDYTAGSDVAVTIT